MSTSDWQIFVVLLAVAWAAWFVARRAAALFGAGRGGGAQDCGSCGPCTKQGEVSTGERVPLVTLDTQPARTSENNGATARPGPTSLDPAP